ncbi:uroporphyrinogen-III synthase [Oerskovia turbata]
MAESKQHESAARTITEADVVVPALAVESASASAPALEQVMAGRTVLVTADRRSADLAAALTRRGAEVRHAAALSMVPNEDDTALLASTRDLIERPPDVVVITTGAGLRGWVEAAHAHGVGEDLLGVLGRARLLARGPKPRGAIQAAGLQVDWVAESETAAEIAELLLGEGVEGLRIAVQHHGTGADGLDEAFTRAGADVVSLVVYRCGPPPDEAALRASVHAAAAGEIDAVVFTSAPAAEAWLAVADSEGVGEAVAAGFSNGMVAASVGPVTAKPFERRGIPTLQPDRSRLGALVRVLVAHYEHAPRHVGSRLEQS